MIDRLLEKYVGPVHRRTEIAIIVACLGAMASGLFAPKSVAGMAVVIGGGTVSYLVALWLAPDPSIVAVQWEEYERQSENVGGDADR